MDLLQTQKDKVSYSIGVNFGHMIKQQLAGVEVNSATFLKGIEASLNNDSTLMTQDEMQKVLQEFQKEMEQKISKQTEENKKIGEDFLAANKKKEGVKVTKSGLQYKVIKSVKEGQIPKSSEKVKVHYAGTLIDGKEFDSSYKRGEPISFAVTGVIKGWTEALQLMKVGEKWQLFIPSDLAYGQRGAGENIGPNQVLIFEVELLGIEK